ncbi:7986_t:CDS:2 [Gigaspora margarita]|uniref:7986_t:CDS:1 n=1 Tax=Gigaspora margarita TaxID=4874 RepID=A0ABM8W5H9_GIGMA|nr:7986_t:CDS:2 [Gigaspora margarita]
MQLFCDRHSPASALYVYEDEIHISALSNEEPIRILADHATNPSYDYIKDICKSYHNLQLGKRNSTSMFQRLLKKLQIIMLLKVNESSIQKSNKNNEYLVPSVSKKDLMYTVNSAIEICSCLSESGAPCKHQEVLLYPNTILE